MASEAQPDAIAQARRVSGPGRRRGPWAILRHLSSAARQLDTFVEGRPFERGNWLVVAFAAGIVLWLVLPSMWHWAAVIALCAAVAMMALAILSKEGDFAWLRASLVALPVMVAAGCLTVWSKSAIVGTPPIARPMVLSLAGMVVDRQDQRAQGRVRLTLTVRLPDRDAPDRDVPVRVRLNLSIDDDSPAFREGARLRLKARLMPPAAPMLPGSYDFARTAWFSGLAATGTIIGKPQLEGTARDPGVLASWRRALSDHVRAQLPGSAGAIATAFASGHRGEIAAADEQAMRDSGLTHLLSISGLHVSAVVAAAYAVAIRLLALWPWLALRVRLPLAAAGFGAISGIAYTLLTGAEVPTVRSCIGAVLVLAALAAGRDPLSMRMVAIAALFVLLFWPEALYGPSFQMSFGAVIAIVALHAAPSVRAFTQPRDEHLLMRLARQAALLFLSGIVIELALMPIGLFHFHRTGAYGALANVIAIPLTTFATMPLIALALLADMVGLGGPVWWAVGQSLELLLWLAHTTAAQPGAVTLSPAMTPFTFALFIAGGLWLGLWSGSVRWAGFVPIAVALALLMSQRPADLLISGDGRHVALAATEDTVLLLRQGRSDYTRSNLEEIAGIGSSRPIDDWPGAQCNKSFCSIALARGGRIVTLLFARGRDFVDIAPLATACRSADIVVADRRLPRSCRPRWIKLDREMLRQTGGVAINLANGTMRTVAQGQGHHGWYRWPDPK